MEFARPLREVFAELAGHDDPGQSGDDHRALLADHAGLPDDLLATAIGSYAGTAPAEVAEHLAPFVAGGEDTGSHALDGLNLLASAPSGVWEGEVELDHSEDGGLADEHGFDQLDHNPDFGHDADLGHLSAVGDLNSADSLDQADHHLTPAAESPAEHAFTEDSAADHSFTDHAGLHFGEAASGGDPTPAHAAVLADDALADSASDADGSADDPDAHHFGEITVDDPDLGIDHLAEPHHDAAELETDHHVDDPGHDDPGHDLGDLDHFHG